MLSICVMSDLHGYLPEVEPCNLVLICGDIVPLRIQHRTKDSYKWFSNEFEEWAMELPCDKVIFIAGNHECTLPNHYKEYKKLFDNESKITYLCHEEYVYKHSDGKEYNIFGTPYCQIFGTWAFMLPDSKLREKYSEIPENLDILLVHDQCYGYGDVLLQKDCPWATGEHIGNKPLTEAILEKQPRYLFTAHLHSTDHNCVMINRTKRYNVSLKDENYQPVYKPLYLEIDK